MLIGTAVADWKERKMANELAALLKALLMC
jgi:hypothetical protein